MNLKDSNLGVETGGWGWAGSEEKGVKRRDGIQERVSCELVPNLHLGGTAFPPLAGRQGWEVQRWVGRLSQPHQGQVLACNINWF